jgi:hypothetical protein
MVEIHYRALLEIGDDQGNNHGRNIYCDSMDEMVAEAKKLIEFGWEINLAHKIKGDFDDVTPVTQMLQRRINETVGKDK